MTPAPRRWQLINANERLKKKKKTMIVLPDESALRSEHERRYQFQFSPPILQHQGWRDGVIEI